MDTKPSSTNSVERLSSPKTEVKRVRFDQRLILSAARGQDFLWIRRKIVDAPEYLGDRTVIRVGERIRVHSYMCSHETDFAGTERRRRRGKNRIGDVRKGKIHALLARRASGGHNSVTAPCASVMRRRSQRSLIRWPRSRRLRQSAPVTRSCRATSGSSHASSSFSATRILLRCMSRLVHREKRSTPQRFRPVCEEFLACG